MHTRDIYGRRSDNGNSSGQAFTALSIPLSPNRLGGKVITASYDNGHTWIEREYGAAGDGRILKIFWKSGDDELWSGSADVSHHMKVLASVVVLMVFYFLAFFKVVDF